MQRSGGQGAGSNALGFCQGGGGFCAVVDNDGVIGAAALLNQPVQAGKRTLRMTGVGENGTDDGHAQDYEG